MTQEQHRAAMDAVWAIYNNRLNRDPDPECSGLIYAIGEGALTYEQADASVVASDEYRALQQPPDEPPAPSGRAGVVRFDGRTMADDGGAYLALGASLFWGVRGARTESDRFRANLDWLKTKGVDFVRILGETSDWAEETKTDPRWPDYEEVVRQCTDLVEAAGLRVAWTLFGGNKLTSAEQWTVAETILRVSKERPHLIQYVEVSNENNGNLAVRDYDAYVRMFTNAGFIAATTSMAHASNTVKVIPAPVATVHFDRIMGDNGWRPVRQPWGYPGEYGNGVPGRFISGEPIGPGASVAQDTDPERLAMNAVHTWLLGGCAHVVHFGAGIYGIQTSHPVGGNRPPNVWEQEALSETLDRIAEYRKQLPSDLPNWTRTRHSFTDHPFTFPPDALETVGDKALDKKHGCVRGYAAHKDGRYVCAIIGIMGSCVLAPQHTTGSTFSLSENDGRSRLLMGDYK